MAFKHLSLSFTALALAVAIGAAPATAVQSASSTPPPGPGLALINERCAFCHSADQVFTAEKTPEEWAQTVQSMMDRGAELTPEEQKAIVTYLGQHYSKKAAAAAPATPGN